MNRKQGVWKGGKKTKMGDEGKHSAHSVFGTPFHSLPVILISNPTTRKIQYHSVPIKEYPIVQFSDEMTPQGSTPKPKNDTRFIYKRASSKPCWSNTLMDGMQKKVPLLFHLWRGSSENACRSLTRSFSIQKTVTVFGSGVRRAVARHQSQTRRTQTDSLSCVGVLSKPPKPRANNSEQGTYPETRIGSEWRAQ